MPHNCICLCQRKKIVSSLIEWVLRWLELYLFVLGYYSYFFFNFLLQLYCISLAKFPSLSSQKMVFIETRENLKEKQLWWVEGISLFLHITKTFKIASNHLVFLWLTWLSVPVITLALQQLIIMIDRGVWQFLFCVLWFKSHMWFICNAMLFPMILHLINF